MLTPIEKLEKAIELADKPEPFREWLESRIYEVYGFIRSSEVYPKGYFEELDFLCDMREK